MNKQQKETVSVALLTLFFFTGLFYCYYYFVGTDFFLFFFCYKQNFKHLREVHISGKKKQEQSSFPGLLSSLEGGFGHFTLVGGIGYLWHFVGSPGGLLGGVRN